MRRRLAREHPGWDADAGSVKAVAVVECEPVHLFRSVVLSRVLLHVHRDTVHGVVQVAARIPRNRVGLCLTPRESVALAHIS